MRRNVTTEEKTTLVRVLLALFRSIQQTQWMIMALKQEDDMAFIKAAEESSKINEQVTDLIGEMIQELESNGKR